MKKSIFSLPHFCIFLLTLVYFSSCENPLLIDAAKLYKVTFETNCDTNIPSYRASAVEKIQTLSKTDATFAGWYTTSSFSGSPITLPYGLSEDTTLYAKWLQRYTVVFETNGGTELASYKTSVISEKPLTTKSDCEFAGWYTTADFAGEAISFPFEVTESLILYAKWNKIYTVMFVTNGGTSISQYQTSTITEPPSTTRAGYTFLAWYLDEDFSTPVAFPYTLDGDTTLYAKWTESAETAYTVEHYKQNSDLASYTLAETVKMTGMTQTNTQAAKKIYTGFTAKNFEQATIAADGSTVVKIYYDRNKYTVYFDANGGSGTMNSQTFYYGVEQTLAGNRFVKTNYTFTGWATSSNGDVMYADSASVINLTAIAGKNLTFYAQWFPGIVVTAATVSTLDLSTLTEDINLRVIGRIANSTLTALAEKIQSANMDVDLDLSEATGLTEISGDNSDWNSVFSKAAKLRKLILPNTLEIIGSKAFQYSQFSSIIIPDSVTVIGEKAFLGCSNISSVEIGNGVTAIGYFAFVNCSKLTSVIIPKSVESIEKAAFYGLTNLSSVKFLNSSSSWLCKNDYYQYTVSVNNAGTNAKNLTSTYSNYLWTKK